MVSLSIKEKIRIMIALNIIKKFHAMLILKIKKAQLIITFNHMIKSKLKMKKINQTINIAYKIVILKINKI